MKSSFVPYALALCTVLCKAVEVTVNNDKPRLDTTGLPMGASDGSLRQFGDTFYVYGTHYQPCPKSDEKYCYEWGANISWPLCGWRNMSYAVYSSTDLNTWKVETLDALPDMHTNDGLNTSNCAFFEPSVEYNKKNNNYVMWFIVQQNGDHGGQGVATSSSPTGPFVINKDGGFPVSGLPASADLYLWKHTDDVVYMKHNANGKGMHANYVTQLSADYTKVVATSAPIENGTYYEGGGVFERDGTWYVMFGQGCCFCDKGGSSRVYTASTPLGDYVFQSEVNSVLPNGTYRVPAQQFGVSSITTASGARQYWYTGMRFGSGSVKTYDSQYWAPLQFFANGTVEQMEWLDQFTVDI